MIAALAARLGLGKLRLGILLGLAGLVVVLGVALWQVRELERVWRREAEAREAATLRELTIAAGVNARQRETIARFEQAAQRAAADAAEAVARAERLARDRDKILGALRRAEDAPPAPVLRDAWQWLRERDAAAARADADGGGGLPAAGAGAAGGLPDAARARP